MIHINWNEFKYFKQGRANPESLDNFQLLLEFIKSFYNISNVYDIFDMLRDDELSAMMLEKRGISDPTHLEDFIYKQRRT